MDNSTLEQRIECLKKRNEFFYDEDIALCIQLLEAWQKVKKDISHRENRLPCSTVGDVAMKSAYVIALEVINEALKEIEKGEQ